VLARLVTQRRDVIVRRFGLEERVVDECRDTRDGREKHGWFLDESG
jgi:hypothetical protein